MPYIQLKDIFGVYFWSNLLEQIDLSWSKEIVILGDFNGVMDSELVRSKIHICLKVFQNWLKEMIVWMYGDSIILEKERSS